MNSQSKKKNEKDVIHKSIMNLAKHFPKNSPSFEMYLFNNFLWNGKHWVSKHFESDVEKTTKQIYQQYKEKYL